MSGLRTKKKYTTIKIRNTIRLHVSFIKGSGVVLQSGFSFSPVRSFHCLGVAGSFSSPELITSMIFDFMEKIHKKFFNPSSDVEKTLFGIPNP